MRRLLILITATFLVVLAASPALATHVADGGADEAWSNQMNQESYWETRFATENRTAECTKWQNHNGHIPAEYDAAVVKDGTMVRVYADLTGVGAFTALGAVNPANDKHFKAPHSWVMKCKFVDKEPEPETAFWCVDGEVIESETMPDGEDVTGPFDTAEEAAENCASEEPEEPETPEEPEEPEEPKTPEEPEEPEEPKTPEEPEEPEEPKTPEEEEEEETTTSTTTPATTSTTGARPEGAPQGAGTGMIGMSVAGLAGLLALFFATRRKKTDLSDNL